MTSDTEDEKTVRFWQEKLDVLRENGITAVFSDTWDGVRFYGYARKKVPRFENDVRHFGCMGATYQDQTDESPDYEVDPPWIIDVATGEMQFPTLMADGHRCIRFPLSYWAQL